MFHNFMGVEHQRPARWRLPDYLAAFLLLWLACSILMQGEG
jgi:hypothetical protein